MLRHHHLRAVLTLGIASFAASLPGMAAAQSPPDLPTSLNDLGTENGSSARSVGAWDVTETVWDSPAAAPTEIKNEVAVRRMVGSMLEEAIHDRSATGPILRVDYLLFDRVEARWQYMSMDTRAAVGLMTAQSYEQGQTGRIDVVFQPFALPGSSSAVPGSGAGGIGLMLRMRQEILRPDPDHEIKNQYFTLADGRGTQWLAHRYAYARRTGPTP